MVYFDQFYSYLKNLQAYVEAQNLQINKLREEVHTLRNEIKAMKDRSIKIDKIEYKFDQLKVETLEGTLNIGLTPNGSNIEDFVINENEGKIAKVEQLNKELLHEIKEKIELYLESDGINIIKEISNKYNFQLEETYHELIITDIKKQMDQRIQLYLSQQKDDQMEVNAEKMKEEIINKVKNDIINAIDSFIKQLPRKER